MLPGFCDSPYGFQAEAHTVDQDEWTGGFVTVVTPA
jgi:hypothetical protein